VRNAKKSTIPNARFANLMHETGLSGAQLARRVGVHESTVSHWRTGLHDVPGAVIAYLDLLAQVRRLVT
jgi:DNA-binding transcriptional regulator YiaG